MVRRPRHQPHPTDRHRQRLLLPSQRLRPRTGCRRHKVNVITDLTPLAEITGLRALYLAHLGTVTALFDESALTELTDLTLTAMTALVDLRPARTGPALSTL
jgi:hypothetical protein